MDYICSKCGKKVSVSTRQARCSCGGLWKLDFTPPPFRPDSIDKSQWSQFRYRKYMALEDESWRALTLGEGMTPVVRMDGNVLLKMDYMMPTLSYKDRGAAVLMAHCKAAGVDYVVQDSSRQRRKQHCRLWRPGPGSPVRSLCPRELLLKRSP